MGLGFGLRALEFDARLRGSTPFHRQCQRHRHCHHNYHHHDYDDYDDDDYDQAQIFWARTTTISVITVVLLLSFYREVDVILRQITLSTEGRACSRLMYHPSHELRLLASCWPAPSTIFASRAEMPCQQRRESSKKGTNPEGFATFGTCLRPTREERVQYSKNLSW